MLERNIKSGYYRRLLSTQDQEQSDDLYSQKSMDFIKAPYVLEFLNVPDKLTGKESILESNIITHLQKFLLELGNKGLGGYHPLKIEIIYGEQYKTTKDAQLALLDYIEVFYNRQRIHSTLGFHTPNDLRWVA